MRSTRLLTMLSVCLISMAADTGETDVLAKMDAAAPSFRGLTADISAISYTKVIDDKTEESGTISLLKTKPKELQVLIQFTKPDARSVAFRGRKAEIYYPKIKTVQEYDLGRSGLIEQFLLLGFGTSGKELASAYQVKLVGAEKIGNQEAWHLELFPKSADLKKSLSKLELWISEDGAYAVQQKVTQPSGDYRVFTYRNVKLNPKLSPNDLALKLPSGVKREFPQK